MCIYIQHCLIKASNATTCFYLTDFLVHFNKALKHFWRLHTYWFIYRFLVHHPAVLSYLPILSCKDTYAAQLHHRYSKILWEQKREPAVVVDHRSSPVVPHESLVWLEKPGIIQEVLIIDVVKLGSRNRIQRSQVGIRIIYIWANILQIVSQRYRKCRIRITGAIKIEEPLLECEALGKANSMCTCMEQMHVKERNLFMGLLFLDMQPTTINWGTRLSVVWFASVWTSSNKNTCSVLKARLDFWKLRNNWS